MKTFLLWESSPDSLEIFTVNGANIAVAFRNFIEFQNKYLVPEHQYKEILKFNAFDLVLKRNDDTVKVYEYLIVNTEDPGVDITVERKRNEIVSI